MNRRTFLAAAAAAPALPAIDSRPIPKYRIVTKYKPAAQPGMPGPYPGRVVTVYSPNCIDETTEKVDVPTVEKMIARGMTTLTGDKNPRDSWARFQRPGFRRDQDQLLRRPRSHVDAGSSG